MAAKPITTGKRIFFFSGWLLALVLLLWIAPRAYHRWFNRLPSTRQEQWQQRVADRQQDLSVPWRDPRPLLIFAGDSQIEYGNWYDLFHGHWAVRNCGLAQARIADVTSLVQSMGDAHPRGVVVMCGINSLGAKMTDEECLRDFGMLLQAIRARLHPETTVVLSVMPLRESPVDRDTRELNARIRNFNLLLQASCQREGASFADISGAVTNRHGALDETLTGDGLHLNGEGYRRLAAALVPRLPKSD